MPFPFCRVVLFVVPNWSRRIDLDLCLLVISHKTSHYLLVMFQILVGIFWSIQIFLIISHTCRELLFFQQKGMVISPSKRLNICMLRKHAHDGGMTTRCFDPGTYHIPWYPMLKRKMHYCSSSSPSTMLGTSNQLDGYGTGSFLKKSIVKWLSDCSPRRLSQNTSPRIKKTCCFRKLMNMSEMNWNYIKHIWLVVSNTFIFPFSWEFHHPNWLSLHHFSEG
jgi:hypothetical protein